MKLHTSFTSIKTADTKKKRLALVGILASVMAFPAVTMADEFGDNTPYYEDDAWYDVSEWFDGNDYNPTDEALGRWDNETFDFDENLTSSDNDNFLNLNDDYGYVDNGARTRQPTSDSDDWFYDYYDDGYFSWQDRYYTSYYDIDDDGLYDAMASYADTDGDGLYEGFDYIAFNNAGQDEQTMNDAKTEQKKLRSGDLEVTGTIKTTKSVEVRDRTHLVAMLQREDGNSVAVDMGKKDALPNIKENTSVTATGHAMKVGDKVILVATEAQLPDQTIQIDRNSAKFSGTIDKLKKMSIRGEEHTFAKITTEEDKNMLVDLGMSADDLSLKKGQNITVQGVPVKLKDRVLLLTRKVTHDGETQEIDRQIAMQE